MQCDNLNRVTLNDTYEHLESNLHTNSSSSVLKCENGILLPRWTPLENVSNGSIAFRGIVYIAALAYLFVGVAVLCDKFMASIEMITSKRKEITVKDEHGRNKTVVVQVWNETVSNLTLMALGCSAPEILLSSIEIIGKGFEAGELGPGSTVGSAAFNLLVIIGVCNYAIPSGQCRRIKRVSVFLVTSTWSIFAYLWLYLITAAISPGVIELWEAILTFAFFPLTVISAYAADRHVHIYDYLSKTYRMGRNGIIVEMTTDETEVVERDLNRRDRANHFKKFAEEDEEIREFEDHRRAFIILLKNLRRKYPHLSANQLELMATKDLLDRGSKSRAFYRSIASKMLIGKNSSEHHHQNLDFTELFQEFHPSDSPAKNSPMNKIDQCITKVFFSPGHYTVMENVGEFSVTIVREDGNLNEMILVDYATEEGDAKSGKDFEASSGTIRFEPGITSKTISIRIIDDQLYEEDQHFYIRLMNLRKPENNQHLSGKGAISDDAYVTVADIHTEPAPSYSTTVVEIEDDFVNYDPPRYSVTAREILSALRSNKNLRRPSWFNFEESSNSDDDEFVDAVSTISAEKDDDVSEENFHDVEETDPTIDALKLEDIDDQNAIRNLSRTTSVESVFSLDKVNPFKSNTVIRKANRPSVEFSFNDNSTIFIGSSSNSSEDGEQLAVHRNYDGNPTNSLLRLVSPSLATVMILDDDHHGIFSLSESDAILTETAGTHSCKIIRVGGSRGRVSLKYRTEEGTAKPSRDYQPVDGDLVFQDGETEKTIALQIVVNQFYEKDVLFYFTIDEPKLIKDENEETDSGINLEELNIRAYSQLSEEQRTALKGRPQLGEVTTQNIRLKESREFKNAVDKLMKRANIVVKRGTSSWKQQIIESINLEQDEEDEIEILRDKKCEVLKYVNYVITVFWRVLWAFLPPENLGSGYPCFLICIVCIGAMTALIGDVASHLGCTVGLKDSVTALAFVALGTSLPDLFASKVSAVQDIHADASISNVTGSNAINVFLGIGVAWLLATIWHTYKGTCFYVDAGTLAFSVTMYCCMALSVTIILLIRRHPSISGGELGGAPFTKMLTTVGFIFMWMIFVLLSSFQDYGYFHAF